MACAASQALFSAYTCTVPSTKLCFKKCNKAKKQSCSFGLFTVRASADDTDCNVEECAPDKEVGKVSLEWLAGEKTKVVGTFPPRKRGWTGYVEKDTAGQTNIYSVEPAVYVAESAISSGTAGSSAEGAENTVAIAGGLALVSVAAASLILFQVSKNPPQMQTVEYSGPPLTYYINKFKPPEIVQASVPSKAESVQPETSAPEVSQIQVESEYQLDSVASIVNSVS